MIRYNKSNVHITSGEDGSVMVEFVNDYARFGICIENKPEESSWYYTDKSYNTAGEMFSKEFVEYLKKF